MKNKFTIGIFNTSSPTPEGMETDYSILSASNISIHEHVICRKVHQGYLSGTINERVSALYDLFEDDTIDLLMSFWGGNNTNQLLPYLDYDRICNNYKPIMGYSDTTALLIAIYKMTNKITYLGPAGITFNKPEPVEYSFNYLKKVFIDRCKSYDIIDSIEYADDYYFLRESPDDKSRDIKINNGRKIYRPGSAEGIVIAGNLQTLLLLAGTNYFPDISNKILFLEISEEATNAAVFHRLMTQLSQVEGFKSIKGFCFGRITSHSNTSDVDIENIFEDIFMNMNIPIIYNLDFGHSDPQFVIPIGGVCCIDTNNNKINFNLSN